MKRLHRCFRTSLPLLALTLTAVAASFSAALSAPAKPLVTLPRGASLEQSLRGLQQADGSVILSEIPTVGRSLETELREATVEKALEEISRSFHLFWIRRPGSIALQRRYADTREVPDLEIEELVASTADLYRLVHAVAPGPIDVTVVTDQRDFYRSLSGEQLQAMQNPERGLSLTALQPDQQKLWSRINLVQAYGTANMDWERAARAFGAWPRTAIVRDANFVEYHEYPDPGDPRGFSRTVDFPDGIVSGVRRRPVEPWGIQLPARARLPETFEKKAVLTGGPIELNSLIRKLDQTAERRISIPKHTTGRRLLAFGSNLPAQNALTALEDLYGWVFNYERENRYSLARPRLSPATDFYDLHRKLNAAVPPPYHRAWSDEGERARDPRFLEQRALVLKEVAKLKGLEWRRVGINELDPATERRLANVLFDRYVRPQMFYVSRRDQPFAWIAEPQRGYFTVEGETGPGKQPLLMFNVRRPDGKIDSWGWVVGTSSLD